MKILMVLLVVASCSSSHPEAPDAAVDAYVPDALVCTTPTKICSVGGVDACTDVSASATNCGDCAIACDVGASCQHSHCCPAAFVPTAMTPSGFDFFFDFAGYTTGNNPLARDAQYDLFSVGYAIGGTPLVDHDYDLSTDVTFYASATHNYTVNTPLGDKFYYAVAGTLRLSAVCGTEMTGTLTNAVFQATDANAAVDPNGCTFSVPSITFHIMSSAACN